MKKKLGTRGQECNHTLESTTTPHWRKEATRKLLHRSRELDLQSTMNTLTHLKEEIADNIHHLGDHRSKKALKEENTLFIYSPFSPQAPHYQFEGVKGCYEEVVDAKLQGSFTIK